MILSEEVGTKKKEQKNQVKFFMNIFLLNSFCIGSAIKNVLKLIYKCLQ